jgi:hypothetical protein
MSRIIQFTHPGGEHGSDRNTPLNKGWNTGGHKRKFMHVEGQYVQHNQVHSGELLFWGEWEPPSSVSELHDRLSPFHPRWLHKPYLPDIIPPNVPQGVSFQNTDPFVFDGVFKYGICKQFKSKTGRITQLANLEVGSLILFGSTRNQNKRDAFFQLDTVFVVSDFIDYDSSVADALSNKDLDFYNRTVFKLAFPSPTLSSMKLRLYFGATYENAIDGMYSFSPSKIFSNCDTGFPRVPLKDLPYLTNNLNAAPKSTRATSLEILEFWKEIRDISRACGCVEGVKFNCW